MKRRIENGTNADQKPRNRPWEVVYGDRYNVRIWRNDLGRGSSELKADIYHKADETHTGSLYEDEVRDINRCLGSALKKMHRYRVRQLWKHFLFPW